MRGRKKENNVIQISTAEVENSATVESSLLAEKLKPSGLGRAASAIWDKIAPGLAAIGRLNENYVDTVSEYCIARAELNKLRRKIAKEGETYASGDLIKPNPLLPQYERIWRRWRSLSVALGLSPSDDRFQDKQKENENDPWSTI